MESRQLRATVVVRYWYGHMGAALVDAGLVSTSREYAVPPDRDVDPFALGAIAVIISEPLV